MINYLQNLKDYADEGVEIERLTANGAQPMNRQIDDMNVLVFQNAHTWGTFQISHEVDLVLLTKFLCVIVHSRRSANISIHEYTNFFFVWHCVVINYIILNTNKLII